MKWEFEVTATKDRRLFSRILQVLENQMLNIHSFAGDGEDESVRIRFVVSSEQDKAYRIETMLHRLENVESVSVVHRVREPGEEFQPI